MSVCIKNCPHCDAAHSELDTNKKRGLYVYSDSAGKFQNSVKSVVCLVCGAFAPTLTIWNMRVGETEETEETNETEQESDEELQNYAPAYWEPDLRNMPYAYKPGNNPAGENACYHCGDCGLELLGGQVGFVAAGTNYANGEHSACPCCGKEHAVFRDEPEEE
jgi:hypothetical protein